MFNKEIKAINEKIKDRLIELQAMLESVADKKIAAFSEEIKNHLADLQKSLEAIVNQGSDNLSQIVSKIKEQTDHITDNLRALQQDTVTSANDLINKTLDEVAKTRNDLHQMVYSALAESSRWQGMITAAQSQLALCSRAAKQEALFSCGSSFFSTVARRTMGYLGYGKKAQNLSEIAITLLICLYSCYKLSDNKNVNFMSFTIASRLLAGVLQPLLRQGMVMNKYPNYHLALYLASFNAALQSSNSGCLLFMGRIIGNYLGLNAGLEGGEALSNAILGKEPENTASTAKVSP
ncbi:hypothetical protein ACFORL_09510 [Legionella dresdenensis]|uniref:Coiled-coil protein n=1 Tax=Legionella dresdenensis TaxID=450200 RepID=A0ABV8CGH7_9GAMM